MKTFLILLAGGLMALTAYAQTTTRHGLKPKNDAVEAAASASALIDTVANPAAHTVDINGYDKPLRSRRETFFVTNNGGRPTSSLAVTITYYDSSRRQLHSRHASLPLVIPVGETRQASLKSWDEQLSFYYLRSAVPSRAEQATPYDVKISVDTIFYAR